ncbi:hypothetical protein AOLI_G00286400 [Acnodon oligacanthus]
MKSHRWYIYIFWHAIILAIINAWLLYKRDCKACIIPKKEMLNRRGFQVQLASSLILVRIHFYKINSQDTKERATIFRQWEPCITVDIMEPCIISDITEHFDIHDSNTTETCDCSEEVMCTTIGCAQGHDRTFPRKNKERTLQTL